MAYIDPCCLTEFVRQETTAHLANLLAAAFRDARLVSTLSELVARLCAEPEVLEAATELSNYVLAQPIMIEVIWH